MRPKGSAKELETRRLLSGKLLQEGRGVREVGRLVGAAPSSISRWKQALDEGGLEALRGKAHPGRPARLSTDQKKQLAQVLLKSPQAAGFATDLWTLARVAKVIEQEFGVRYHPGHVWYILRDIGWSCQKPERRARERDEAAIEQWRTEEWPEAKKRHATEAGASS